jgi:hypothetical protein
MKDSFGIVLVTFEIVSKGEGKCFEIRERS